MRSKSFLGSKALVGAILLPLLVGDILRANDDRQGPPFEVVEPPSLEVGFDPILGDFRLDRDQPTIFLAYVGRGAETDLGSVRFLEQREVSQSRHPGKYVWLRIVNNSIWAISLTTLGTSTGATPEMVQTDEGTYSFAIADGSEIAPVYLVEEKSGKVRAIGSDSRGVSWLPSGRSAIFSVQPAYLKRGRTVVIQFNYRWESDKGRLRSREPSHRVEFDSRSLPDDSK